MGGVSNDPEQLRRIEEKSMCAQHQVKLTECFELHHQAQELYVLKLRLPCGHLCDRPQGEYGVEWCDAGEHRYKLQLVENGRAWNAWMIEGKIG